MAIVIQIEAGSGLAIVTCSGILGLSDALESVSTLWKHPEWSGESAVWDFREAQLDVSSSDVRGAAGFVLRHQRATPPSRVAWVMQREVDYGMARVFEVFRHDPSTEFSVFRDHEAALSWARYPEKDATDTRLPTETG